MSRTLVLLLTLVAAGCAKEQILEPNAPTETKQAAAGEAFTLQLGQTAELRAEGLSVEFTSVPEDSRCPEGVTCVWEGNARVHLEVSREGSAPATVELNTTLEPRQGSYAGYDFQLVSLAPYPREGSTMEPRDYVATLRVTER